MKNAKFYINYIVLIAILLLMNSCTKSFEKYNTDSNGISEKELSVDFNNIGQFFPPIEQAYDFIGDINQNVQMDVGFLGGAGGYGGYFSNTYIGQTLSNYSFSANTLNNQMLFPWGYNYVMSPIENIARGGARVSAPDFWAIALILQVGAMQKVTDMYGPIPYSKFGQGGSTVSYDSQESIYNLFFSQLDTAVNNLKAYIANRPGAKPFKKFDEVYGGDYTKWLKYANSLRLRLAMQIVKVDPQEAQTQAEKAVNPSSGGVLTTNTDNALVSGAINPVEISLHEWQDNHVNANIVSYMLGYNDPRVSKYFEPSTIVPGQYIGLRFGGAYDAQSITLQFTNATNDINRQSPFILMTAAEVYFLRAEGALRGWNMGGTAEDLYNEGIDASFAQWGVGSDASAYINNSTSIPANYVDPSNSHNNINALSTIPIQWIANGSKEQNLEQIITQKWIATYPYGCSEAWATFRRTGYPRLFPVVNNFSGGTVNTTIQIRRVPYPQTEYENNSAAVTQAVQMLGGPDDGGTRVWWDINEGNF